MWTTPLVQRSTHNRPAKDEEILQRMTKAREFSGKRRGISASTAPKQFANVIEDSTEGSTTKGEGTASGILYGLFSPLLV